MSPFEVEIACVRINNQKQLIFIKHKHNTYLKLQAMDPFMATVHDSLFGIGHAIGLVVPSINPKHEESGAPFLSIASAKLGLSSQTRSKLVSK